MCGSFMNPLPPNEELLLRVRKIDQFQHDTFLILAKKLDKMIVILDDMLKIIKPRKEKIMSKKHPGFKAVQNKIAAKQGVSKKAAGAILASSTRKASAKAKRANPRLNKVRG
jgi:hypothetical protein